jgi:hypothetical protein
MEDLQSPPNLLDLYMVLHQTQAAAAADMDKLKPEVIDLLQGLSLPYYHNNYTFSVGTRNSFDYAPCEDAYLNSLLERQEQLKALIADRQKLLQQMKGGGVLESPSGLEHIAGPPANNPTYYPIVKAKATKA